MRKRDRYRRLDRVPAQAIERAIAFGVRAKKAFPFSEVLAQLWRTKAVVAKPPPILQADFL